MKSKSNILKWKTKKPPHTKKQPGPEVKSHLYSAKLMKKAIQLSQ